MQKIVVVGGALLCLGCAGLVDEGAAPVPIQVINPDGSTQTITQGDETAIPEDFPLPLPPGLAPESSILSTDGGPMILTYRLADEAQAEAMVTFYAAWLENKGAKFEVESTNLAGMKSTSILTKLPDTEVAITVMDGMGTRMLTLMVQPR